MKKWMIIILTATLSIVLVVTVLTGGFTKGVLSGKIYRPQNVYEEIWNLVLIEQYAHDRTVLTASTKGAEVDFDFGFEFVGIHIPECNVTISWWRFGAGKELSFLFPLGQGEYAHFVYNYETKTLFGDREFSYLMDHFLADYFVWCEAATDFASGYSTEALGDFAFRYENPLWKREY